jgi:hypothetical protein
MENQSAVNVGEVWQDLTTLPSMPLYRIVQPPHSFLEKYSITKEEEERVVCAVNLADDRRKIKLFTVEVLIRDYRRI